MPGETVLKVEDLRKTFKARGRAHGTVEAIRGVSFELARGEILGIVGETGCGKSTIARCVAGLTSPTAGTIVFGDCDLSKLDARGWRATRRHLQIVFQNPYLSLDPLMTAREIVREPLIIHRLGSRDWSASHSLSVLESVGIGAGDAGKRPSQLSGGQRQRVAIARALVTDPEVLILDEPVSALDVSIQAQVVNLLLDLQRQRKLTCLIILHDLAVASQMCDRIAVVYLGSIVEQGLAQRVLRRPMHPYTKGLLAAVPRLGRPISRMEGTRLLQGDADDAGEHVGCRFRPRCQLSRGAEICRSAEPSLRALNTGQLVACHLVGEAQPAGPRR